jgi:diguanylate cyclase (GGDEF)-like protein
VRLDHERLIGDVSAGLLHATSAVQACGATVRAIGRHAPVVAAVLLHVRDRLRCVAATGSWQVFSSLPPNAGVVGRVYISGKTEVVFEVGADPDYIPLGPPSALEICAPVPGAGRTIGALNVEWTTRVDADEWRTTVEEIAVRLGERIGQLGGTPAETRSEKMLRHALAMTVATTQDELLAVSIEAARDVSGLATAILATPTRPGVRVFTATSAPTEFEARLHARLADGGQEDPEHLLDRIRRYGAAYSLGDPAHLDAQGFAALVDAGARTMIAVPVGPERDGPVLLVVDAAATTPDPATVNLLELLAAQAWTCLDRLRTEAKLHKRASFDPLTGLGHHGSFGERLTAATPGRTALLAIDVDDFKTINDTYGHQAGDQVLVDLARALQSALRSGDELYRIGGDEFVAVVDVQRSAEAVGIAERLTGAAHRIGRTISVGVALQGTGESADLTLRRADAALYDVKRDGRDGVRLAPESS